MRLAVGGNRHFIYRSDDDVNIKNGRVALQGYNDANYAGDRKVCKSVSGCVVCTNGMIVGWICKKQASVALSTMEADFIVALLATG